MINNFLSLKFIQKFRLIHVKKTTQLRSDSIQVCAENLRPGKEKNIKISAELMKRVGKVYVLQIKKYKLSCNLDSKNLENSTTADKGKIKFAHRNLWKLRGL